MLFRARSLALIAILWFGLSSCPAPAQVIVPPTTQPDQPGGAVEQAYRNMPWPVKLGLRSLLITQAFPLVDRVVLVPDAATYVDELSKWSPQGRWPVLIEDDLYTPMFVRRFAPAKLLQRESVNHPLPQDPGARQKLLESVVIHAFGGNPPPEGRDTIAAAFQQQQYIPPGIVITSVDDPAWTAAVALAAGRGQPLAWLNEPFGAPDDEINDETAHRLIDAVDALMAQQHYSFRSLGDDLDAITICRAVASKAIVKLPADARVSVGGPYDDGPVAVTDLLGRNADGSRYAITGWIFGDEVRCAYMAMCSMFLPRDHAWLCNTYPSDGQWGAYGIADAAATLTKSGFTVRQTQGREADEQTWLRELVGGVSTDLLVMNTKGASDFFDLSSGRGYPGDVPILNQPIVLHLIHSWSMQAPSRPDTVGAQWLRHGAYAAVGSCHEPYLGAFVPPNELVKRCLSFVPFLAAARWWDQQGPLSRAWRIVTIGDPLMLCAPPQRLAKPRLAELPGLADQDLDLAEHVKMLMRQAQDDQSGAAFGEAITILNMLGGGADEIACGLWQLAAERGLESSAATRAARPALGPLFRRRNEVEFLRAWSCLPTRDEQAVNMLWHLFTPRLGLGNSAINADTLAQLQSAIRQPLPQQDLERLAPVLARAFDKAHVQAVIQRELDKTTSTNARQALVELLKKY